MHYAILIWDSDKLEYQIIHYSHSYEDMEKMMQKYPEDKGYVHMIDLKWIKGHEFKEKFRLLREAQVQT